MALRRYKATNKVLQATATILKANLKSATVSFLDGVDVKGIVVERPSNYTWDDEEVPKNGLVYQFGWFEEDVRKGILHVASEMYIGPNPQRGGEVQFLGEFGFEILLPDEKKDYISIIIPLLIAMKPALGEIGIHGGSILDSYWRRG